MSDEDERSQAPPMQRRGGNRQPEQRMLRASMVRRVPVQDERTAYMHDALLPQGPPTEQTELVPRVRSTGETRPEAPRGTIPMLPRSVLETNVYAPPVIAYTPGELTDFVSRMYGRAPGDDDATAT